MKTQKNDTFKMWLEVKKSAWTRFKMTLYFRRELGMTSDITNMWLTRSLISDGFSWMRLHNMNWVQGKWKFQWKTIISGSFARKCCSNWRAYHHRFANLLVSRETYSVCLTTCDWSNREKRAGHTRKRQ